MLIPFLTLPSKPLLPSHRKLQNFTTPDESLMNVCCVCVDWHFFHIHIGIELKLISVCLINDYSLIADLHKGPVTIPTIVDLGQNVRSNLVFIVQFFVLIPNLASDLPYAAYFGGKSTSKFGVPALFERLALGCSRWN